MTVSVIIPAFNYAQFISDTLDSVLSQTLGDWECLIVDDGSTDATAEIVSAYCRRDSRFRLLYQSHRGQAAARNTALQVAGGRYVQLLDADDLIESDKLRVQSQFLDRHSEVGVVYGDARFFPSDRPSERWISLNGSDRPWMPCISALGPRLLLALIEKNIMVINSPLVRRDVLRDVGGFDETLARADDWDMWLRCAQAGNRFEYLAHPQTMALVRVHSASLTRRDRRLLASSLAIHRKLAEAPLDPEVRGANDRVLQWLQQVHELACRIDQYVTANCPIIFVDDDKVRPELLGYPLIPFTERAGKYWGPPATSELAIAELERLRASGARYIVFAWPAMWYLDQYPALRTHLDSRYRAVCSDGIAAIYEGAAQPQEDSQ